MQSTAEEPLSPIVVMAVVMRRGREWRIGEGGSSDKKSMVVSTSALVSLKKKKSYVGQYCSCDTEKLFCRNICDFVYVCVCLK